MKSFTIVISNVIFGRRSGIVVFYSIVFVRVKHACNALFHFRSCGIVKSMSSSCEFFEPLLIFIRFRSETECIIYEISKVDRKESKTCKLRVN